MRISATELDQWQSYVDGVIDLPELVSRLTPDQFEESEAMFFGTAFHEFLENVPTGEVCEEFTSQGITFRVPNEIAVQLPQVREAKTEKEYLIDREPVTLVSKCDLIHGVEVGDHKLTEKFDSERYMDSWQWRAYLTLFPADEFTYNVFVCERGTMECEIKALHQLKLYRYEGMERDVEETLKDLVRFIKRYVPIRVLHGDEKNLSEKFGVPLAHSSDSL